MGIEFLFGQNIAAILSGERAVSEDPINVVLLLGPGEVLDHTSHEKDTIVARRQTTPQDTRYSSVWMQESSRRLTPYGLDHERLAKKSSRNCLAGHLGAWGREHAPHEKVISGCHRETVLQVIWGPGAGNTLLTCVLGLDRDLRKHEDMIRITLALELRPQISLLIIQTPNARGSDVDTPETLHESAVLVASHQRVSPDATRQRTAS
nr:hypothetical protein CFP56_71018 [Quercus suber]